MKTAFKNSNLAYLGAIPKHWKVIKIKYLFNEVSIKNQGSKQQLVASQSYGVIPKNLYRNRTVEVTESNLNLLKLVKAGNFVISLRSFEGGIEYSSYEGIISPAYTILEAKQNIEYSYFKFFFKSAIFITTLQSYKIGIREGQNIAYEKLQQDFIPLPPLEEQKEIAEFLDEKCAKIENFIRKKESIIALLNEKKQALINETTTKGLHKTAFKNSNLAYLGEIPKHWELKRLSSFGKFLKGGNISKSDLTDDSMGVFCILYGDIYTKYEIKTHIFKSKISKEFSNSATPIFKGDILFSGSGETKEDIGKNIVYLGDKKAFAGGDIIIFRQKENDSLFLSYILNSEYAKFYKYIESYGEIVVHIYSSNLRNLKIPLPPLEEQKEIAEFLDEKCAKIDLAIQKIKEQIEIIKTYKTSLINEAVCGRMERK